jgi:hypothetical protein
MAPGRGWVTRGPPLPLPHPETQGGTGREHSVAESGPPRGECLAGTERCPANAGYGAIWAQSAGSRTSCIHAWTSAVSTR